MDRTGFGQKGPVATMRKEWYVILAFSNESWCVTCKTRCNVQGHRAPAGGTARVCASQSYGNPRELTEVTFAKGSHARAT